MLNRNTFFAVSVGKNILNNGQKENEFYMNIQEMLSKMDSKMLMQGLKQLSQGLNAEQLAQAEAAIKSASKSPELQGADINALQKQLQQNPDLIRSLAQNTELIEKLQKIVKK